MLVLLLGGYVKIGVVEFASKLAEKKIFLIVLILVKNMYVKIDFWLKYAVVYLL